MTDNNINGSSKSSEITTVQGHELSVVEYHGQRVVSLAMIDEVHERPNGTARKRFNDNKVRFIKEEDFWEINKPSEIRTLGLARADGSTPAKIILLTESGYLMLVKSFTDDLAWNVQRQLVNGYFRAQEKQPRIETKEPRRRRPAILSTFNTGYKIALKLGFDKNQAISYGDRYYRNKCGESPVEMMELPAMPAPTNDAYLLPTQIGKKLGGLSAIKVNKLLAAKGLQEESKGSTSGCPWSMTATGKRYGRLFDGVRKNGTGTAITLKWSSNVIPLLSSKEKAA